MVKEPPLCPHCGAHMEPADEFCADCGGARAAPKQKKLVSKKKPGPKPKPKLEQGPKRDSKTILVVDDDLNTLLVLQKILEKDGYNVDLAATGEDAISKLRNIQPDLVILDVKMPGMSGIDVCKRLRDDPVGRGVKVIFLTVVNYTADMKKNLETLNVSDYITKPFKMRDLLRSIREALL